MQAARRSISGAVLEVLPGSAAALSPFSSRSGGIQASRRAFFFQALVGWTEIPATVPETQQDSQNAVIKSRFPIPTKTTLPRSGFSTANSPHPNLKCMKPNIHKIEEMFPFG